ncbi:26256_t:CDS:2 [Dentiscutata erythropus]|uniref:26256_t:CDS:1 n=1 Tax=Dentiscutata erythropus TaxID=1348616 RepID=A0A9N9IM08_9GLOM|nr:26256_t:CDS:2 [Dentiscutata erythropus]
MARVKSGIACSTITQKKRRIWNAYEKLAAITFQERTQTKLMLARPHICRLNTGSRPKYPELEVELSSWIRVLQAELKVVTRNMVQVKVKNLAQTQSNRRRTTVLQHLSEDYDEKQQAFLSFVLFQ